MCGELPPHDAGFALIKMIKVNKMCRAEWGGLPPRTHTMGRYKVPHRKANRIHAFKKTLGLAAPWSWHPKTNGRALGANPLDRKTAVFKKTPNLPRNDLRVRDPPVYLGPKHISPQLARLDLASPVRFDAEGGRGGSEAGAGFPSLPAGPIQNAKRGQRGPRLIYPTGNHPSYSVRPKNRVGAKQPGYSGGCNLCGRQG